jgi:hypothetical protein
MAGSQRAAPGGAGAGGAKFEKGKLVERPKGAPDEEINEVTA